MPTEQEHHEQLDNVKFYYAKAQKFYEHAWYGGNKGLGLHYGLWDEGVGNRIQAIVKENEVLADLAHIHSGDLVLDAGCGVGGSGIWLSQNRGAEVVGINIAENQLGIAQELKHKFAAEDVVFTEADYHRLPFKSGSFDIFWSLESIEHSDNPELLIQEAFRILKPGGEAVIAGTFMGRGEPTKEQEKQLLVGFQAAGAFNDFRSADNIAWLMRDSGFGKVKNIDVTKLVMPSAREMRIMCQLGLPFARLGHSINGFVSDIMVKNTEWGTYQENLFKEDITSYNILVAEKLLND